MFCKNCGNKLNDKAAFCMQCGFKAGDGNHYCGECGAKVEEGQGICIKCGCLLHESTVQSTQAAEQINSEINTDYYTKYVPHIKKYNLFSIISACLMAVIMILAVFCPLFSYEKTFDLTNPSDLAAIKDKEDLEEIMKNNGKLVKNYSLFDEISTSINALLADEDERYSLIDFDSAFGSSSIKVDKSKSETKNIMNLWISGALVAFFLFGLLFALIFGIIKDIKTHLSLDSDSTRMRNIYKNLVINHQKKINSIDLAISNEIHAGNTNWHGIITVFSILSGLVGVIMFLANRNIVSDIEFYSLMKYSLNSVKYTDTNAIFFFVIMVVFFVIMIPFARLNFLVAKKIDEEISKDLNEIN